MKAALATVTAILAFPISLTLLFVGAQIPAYFMGVAPVTLEHMSQTEVSSEAVAEAWADRDKAGISRTLTLGLLGLDVDLHSTDLGDADTRVRGGEEPYLAALIETSGVAADDAHPRHGVAGLLVKSVVRDTLLRMLEGSRNRWVEHTLAARGLTGMPRFAPVDTAAGAPLDGAILTTALLTQVDAIPLPLSESLDALIQAATDHGDASALTQLDEIFLNILSLAKQLDWTSLRATTARAKTWADLEWLAKSSLVQESTDRSRYLPIAAWLLAENTRALRSYTERWGESGWLAIDTAAALSPAALDFLLDEYVPLYEKPTWLAARYPGLSRAAESFFLTHLPAQPELQRGAKSLVFASAGMLIAATILLFVAVTGRHGRFRGKAITASIASGALACVTAWVLTEPALLAQMEREANATQLNLSNTAILANNSPPTMNTGDIDQVTLLILGVFLLLQTIVYVICLVRVSDIKRQPVTPELKIDLLNNEENLFDLGLYIGLGGTVFSLIMISLGVVEASLMAAYASTLFGILFVAVLKVFNVRPLKRRLLLERG